jgi:hypothetical protein
MNNIFFTFNHAWKKGEILIQPKIDFNTLELIGSESPLVKYPDFNVKKGTKKFDILSFNNSSNFAISEKLKVLLEKNNLTGWSCFPIVIEGLNEKYYAFQNLSEAGIILNLEDYNSYEEECIKFNVNNWSKSDIFHLKDSLINVCTKKVKDILENSEITNIEFNPCIGLSHVEPDLQFGPEHRAICRCRLMSERSKVWI